LTPGAKHTRKLEVFVMRLLNNTRKHLVLALRGKPEGHKSAKNTRKLEVFVVGLLTNTRKHEVSGGIQTPPGGVKKGNWSPNGRNGPCGALFADGFAAVSRPAKTVKMGSGPQRPQNRPFWWWGWHPINM
jgi:hypothetical protein